MLKTPIVHEQKPLTSNQQATLQVPVYGKIFSIPLRFTLSTGADATIAAIRAQIGNIRLTVNGKDLVNVSVSKLLDLYESMGQYVNIPAGVDGCIELNVGRLIFDNPEIRDSFGIGTRNVTSIQVSVTAGTLTTITAVQAFSSRTSENENLGLYCKFINYPQSFNAIAEHTVDTLPRDPDSSYLLVMTDTGSTGVIGTGEVRVNNVTLKERQPSQLNKLLLSNDRLTQPTGYFNYAFTDGSITSQLPMAGVTDLRFINNFTTAPGVAGYNMTALTINNIPVNTK